MRLQEAERSLREVQQDKEIGDRLRMKLESQMETAQHQVVLAEEKVQSLTREARVWQVCPPSCPLLCGLTDSHSDTAQ
jgi:hypothetical protein